MKKAKTKRKLIPRTRNAETLTESAYWGKIRSTLRSAFRYWKPMIIALNDASRPSKSKNKRLKKEYQCAVCEEWFKRADVQIDHIIPCGSLKCYTDIEPFIKNLTPEDPKAFQVLCKPDHQLKTNLERKLKK
tara:strand:+ start:5101 stop:5496 length:396 start_codon:yes stop_codon:yes gene_type:complete